LCWEKQKTVMLLRKRFLIGISKAHQKDLCMLKQDLRTSKYRGPQLLKMNQDLRTTKYRGPQMLKMYQDLRTTKYRGPEDLILKSYQDDK